MCWSNYFQLSVDGFIRIHNLLRVFLQGPRRKQTLNENAPEILTHSTLAGRVVQWMFSIWMEIVYDMLCTAHTFTHTHKCSFTNYFISDNIFPLPVFICVLHAYRIATHLLERAYTHFSHIPHQLGEKFLPVCNFTLCLFNYDPLGG